MEGVDDLNLTSDVSDLDFDRSALASWRQFAERLAEVLSVMAAGATLAIGSLALEGETTPHVLFTCREGGELVAEAAMTTGTLAWAGAAASAAKGRRARKNAKTSRPESRFMKAPSRPCPAWGCTS